jgi:hypothetical protein
MDWKAMLRTEELMRDGNAKHSTLSLTKVAAPHALDDLATVDCWG